MTPPAVEPRQTVVALDCFVTLVTLPSHVTLHLHQSWLY